MLVCLYSGIIFLVGPADNGLKRLLQILLLHIARANDNLAKFDAPGRFHNGMVAFCQIVFSRREIIDFAGPFEPDSYNGNQFHISLSN